MKPTKISTKIKIIGAALVLSILSVIAITIYLNENNIKDALIVNIAGKERMLTQKISKNIFYLYHNENIDFSELDNAVEEFIYNINSLKDGNKLQGIPSAPTDTIAQQISKVLILWNSFHKNVISFKDLLVDRKENEKLLKMRVSTIYNTNNILLQEVDNLVTMYTKHTESKTNYIKKFQYGGAIVLFILIIYSLLQLKIIELHAQEFIDYSKKLASFDDVNNLELITIDAEGEIVEVNDSMNCFITKVNSAMEHSNEAIAQSLQASSKLEEITDEFDTILNDITNSSEISKELNISEDIVIESTEELINSTKKLQHLKDKLDNLLTQCKL
ncbi:MAG: type IV pili methyl-accepting chemotaxis transducer N-terminal domain-containing protein [Arcobacteraceae bacterium]|nr:type IV pili methyl-accepting chemotaxis transducer N-terminal domain-containing protein [Arcobacteraceae bacterium]